jgi:hypothetical protein
MIKQLFKVAKKRFYQVFKIFESHPDFIKTIIGAYSRLHKPSSSAKETHQEIHDLLSLLLIHYHKVLNAAISASQSIEEAIQNAYSDNCLSAAFDAMGPLLTHSDE